MPREVNGDLFGIRLVLKVIITVGGGQLVLSYLLSNPHLYTECKTNAIMYVLLSENTEEVKVSLLNN